MSDTTGGEPPSYPPERHLLRDLRSSTERVATDHAIVRAPVPPEVCTDAGGMEVGAVCCLVDTVGAMIGLAAVHPDWIATADLAYHSRRAIRSGPVVLEARPARVGKSLVVVRCEVWDGQGSSTPGDGVAAGVATMTFARIPGSATQMRVEDPAAGVGTVTEMALPTSGFTRRFEEELGVRVVDAPGGVLELDKTDYVRNSFGTINGGAMAALLSAAAREAARDASGTPLVTADLQIHYLAQTGEGPARTRADVLRHDDRWATVAVEAVDASTGTVVAMATAAAALLR